MAILMLQHKQVHWEPFLMILTLQSFELKGLSKVLVNAVGFGGNAVSVLLSL